MDLGLLTQRVFDALLNGAIYSSLALALVLIYRSTGRLNFAQGEMATFSAYLAFVLLMGPVPGLKLGGIAGWLPGVPWSVPVALSAAVLLGTLAGAATERVLIRPLREAPELAVVNVTIGLLLGINALTGLLWGTGPRFFPAVFPVGSSDFIGIGGARLRYSTLGTWIVLSTLLALLGLLLTKTRVGLAFRAVSINRHSAELHGIRADRTLTYGWALAAALGATAACLSANSVLLEPNMMLRVLVYAFAAATLGGLDSPKGALLGGIIVGLSETLIPAYVPFIGFELSVVPPLIALVAVLFVRPAGLFGTARLERV